MQTTKVVIVVRRSFSSLALPAYSQSFKKKAVTPAPSGESKPRVDEKAYNAALDRIPTPKRPTTWGWSARPSDEPAKLASEIWQVNSPGFVVAIQRANGRSHRAPRPAGQ